MVLRVVACSLRPGGYDKVRLTSEIKNGIGGSSALVSHVIRKMQLN